jgi:hypothetical protein
MKGFGIVEALANKRSICRTAERKKGIEEALRDGVERGPDLLT